MIFALFFLLSKAADTVSIRGALLERGTLKPIAGATVHLLPSKVSATTDPMGRFSFDRVSPGRIQWAVRLSGYANLDLDDLLPSDGPNPSRDLYLERLSYQVYETTIHAGAAKRDAKAKTVEKEEFKAPGSSNDAIKAVQNLPGATTPNFFSPALLIEGSAPEQTRFSIDGFRVPSVFHFGGFQTLIPTEALDRVDFLTAGHGPEFGQALGGHVNAWTVAPERDRLKGFAFLDVFNVGGLAQGRIGESGSGLVSARYGYAGALASVLAQDTALFTLTSTPIYADASALYETPLPNNARFRWLTLGSYDTLG